MGMMNLNQPATLSFSDKRREPKLPTLTGHGFVAVNQVL
jgi:hypothetical protein